MRPAAPEPILVIHPDPSIRLRSQTPSSLALPDASRGRHMHKSVHFAEPDEELPGLGDLASCVLHG